MAAKQMDYTRKRNSALGGLQCLSHFFNFILLVVGGGASALGFWIFYTLREDEQRGDIFNMLGFIYLCTHLGTMSEGLFLVAIVLFGIIAICTINRCALIWYFSFLIVACVASLVFTIMTFLIFLPLETTVNTALSDNVQNNYGLFGNEETTKLVDNLQKSFQCCGSRSYEDWHSSEWYKVQRLGYFDRSKAPVHPESCCVLTSMEQPVNITGCGSIDMDYPNKFIHSEPCSEKVYEWLHWPTLYLGFAGVAMFFSIIFEIGTTSALLRTLGPMEAKPKPIDRQLLVLTSSQYSESEDSWSSTRERPKKATPQTKNTKDQEKTELDTKARLDIREGGYVNTAFRHEAEEQATPL